MFYHALKDTHNDNSCSRRLSLLTLALAFAASTAFCPTSSTVIGNTRTCAGLQKETKPIVARKSLATNILVLKMASDNVSGSFFNRVPDSNDDNNNDDASQNPNDSRSSDVTNTNIDPFEASMTELMRKRSKKPLASKPSTLGGIPTSKATGM